MEILRGRKDLQVNEALQDHRAQKVKKEMSDLAARRVKSVQLDQKVPREFKEFLEPILLRMLLWHREII